MVLRFLRITAEAVVECGIKSLVGMVPGGAFAVAVYERVCKKYREQRQEDKLTADVLALAPATAEQVKAEAAQAALEAVNATNDSSLTSEDLVGLEFFLTTIPEAVRQSLKRPEDPTGTTAPSHYRINGPDDLLNVLPARVPRFRPGGSLPGKPGWVLERLLGIGGFGEVWYARHARMSSLSGAVKFCLGQSGSDLIHEASVIDRVMTAGRHPNIVPLLDVHLDGDTPWILFEYVAGGNLTDGVHRLAGMPPEARVRQVIAGLTQLTEGVRFFHGLTPPIVHRDLKPSNILLDAASGRFRITDFGIGAVTAKETLRLESHGQSTHGGRLLTCLRGSHTPLYASPQQRRGAVPDPRDDVHALGVIGFQMFTGKIDQAPGPRYARILQDLGVPDGVVELIGDCVDEEPDRRPANAAELVVRLKQAFPISPPSAGLASPTDRAPESPPPTPQHRVPDETPRAKGTAAPWTTERGAQGRRTSQADRTLTQRLGRLALGLRTQGSRLLSWRVLAVAGILLLAGTLAWLGAGVFWPAHLERTLGGDANYYVWSPDGKKLLTYYKRERPVIWDIETGQNWSSLEGIPDDNESVRGEWSPKGDAIMLIDSQAVRIWDTGSASFASPARTLKMGTNAPVTASWHPKDRKVLVVGADPLTSTGSAPKRYALVFDVNTGQPMVSLRHRLHPWSEINTATWNRDGTMILTHASLDDKIHALTVWDAANGRELADLSESSTEYRGMASWSPDGSKVLVLDRGEKTVSVREPSSGKRVHTLAGHTAAITMSVWNAPGTHVLTVGQDKTVRIWDSATGGEVFRVSGHERDASLVMSGAWNPDGSRVLTGAQDRTLRVWDVAAKREVCAIPSTVLYASPTHWSSDGSKLLTHEGEKELKVWDANTGNEIASFRNARRRFYGGLWQPGGNKVASMDEANTVRIWVAPK